ncbi:tRNA-uridine aminocarboxypropyltransferase [Sulfurimonas sp. HSL3-2]|uniref:tRNA-uridine aminocarboxypropyltransferase n=1 Tax=Hydrocurvibacter mobilis TaxID=3131936 RepID=UPI0031F8AD1F
MIDEIREQCYKCYRPRSSCMCLHVRAVETKTKFVILMHPKEYRKIKNGTGHLTHLSLPNSELYVGIDFSSHNRINEILGDEKNICYLLYPGKDAIEINSHKISREGRDVVIFVIDSTWACSKKMLRLSENISSLQSISFTHTKKSEFAIKEQPEDYCLSTIESVLCVMEILDKNGEEEITKESFEGFLNPFKKMIDFQIEYMQECKNPRF